MSFGATFHRPPLLIMQTAMYNGGSNDTFSRDNPISNHYVLYLYFAEIENRTMVEFRVFNILVNHVPWVINFDILANRSGVLYENMQLTTLIESPVLSFSFTCLPSANLAQPPVINAAEALNLSEIMALQPLDQDGKLNSLTLQNGSGSSSISSCDSLHVHFILRFATSFFLFK